LAYCVQHGLALDNYLAIDHALQRAIARELMRVMELQSHEMAVGTDGCSAPNYAVPLSRLALGYARLAAGSGACGASLARLSQAMRSHPDLVSGSGRNDEAFMRIGRGDWVSKVGADGVQAIGSCSRQTGLAIKIADGSKPALFAAAVEAMDQLGWLDAQQRQALQPWRAADIRSIKGEQVGLRRPVFTLAKH
jgi:L-asparaginase II